MLAPSANVPNRPEPVVSCWVNSGLGARHRALPTSTQMRSLPSRPGELPSRPGELLRGGPINIPSWLAMWFAATRT